MAYITNAQQKTLEKVYKEINDNGKVDFNTMQDFSELMQVIQSDKDKAKEKTRLAVAEKRKNPIERAKRNAYERERRRKKALSNKAM